MIFPGAFQTHTLQKVTFEGAETKVMPDAFEEMNFPEREFTNETHGLDEVRYEVKDGKKDLAYLPPYYCGPLTIEEDTVLFAGKTLADLRDYPGITELTVLPSSWQKLIDHLPQYLRKLTLPDYVTKLKLEGQKELLEFNFPTDATEIRISESPMLELDIPEDYKAK